MSRCLRRSIENDIGPFLKMFEKLMSEVKWQSRYANWINVRGACVLRSPEFAQCVAKALQFFHAKRLQCGDFVVMPNHVHWIVMPLATFDLSKIMQSVKRHISRELGKLDVAMLGKLWQHESYDRCIRDREELNRIRDYIEQNPAKAKLRADEFFIVGRVAGWVGSRCCRVQLGGT